MGVPPIRASGVISAYARHATTTAPTMSSGIFTPTNARTRAQATAEPTNRVRAGAAGNGSDVALGLIRFVDPRMRSLNYSNSPIASCVPKGANGIYRLLQPEARAADYRRRHTRLRPETVSLGAETLMQRRQLIAKTALL